MPTLTRLREPISAISSTTPARNQLPLLFKISPYAISSTPEGALGSHGGVLLKPWMPRAGGWRENQRQMAGTFVPPEITSRWPLQNRLAMSKNGYIQFFETSKEAAAIMGEETSGIVAEVQRDPIRARVNADGETKAKATADRIAKMNRGKALKRLERLGLAVGAEPPKGDEAPAEAAAVAAS